MFIENTVQAGFSCSDDRGPGLELFHWSLVVGFSVAYLTEDDLLTVHVWAGYVVGLLIVARIVWGLVGSRHARFSDFIYDPATTLRYVRDLVLFRAQRHLGHSPGGGAMVITLLLFLTATVLTGLIVYGGDQQAGPLAGLFTKDTGEAMEGLHEILANVTLALILAHVGRCGPSELCASGESGPCDVHRV